MRTIKVSIGKQELNLYDDGICIRSYSVSTSKYGTGFEEGSFKTPTGKFVIYKKIGDNELIYTTFVARVPNGVWNQKDKDGDPITSRILWLSGLDTENSNTKDRFIYIHGTTEESLIGSPASHGCIRMFNTDVVELFNLVEETTPVFINE